jgi:hypothetical protein
LWTPFRCLKFPGKLAATENAARENELAVKRSSAKYPSLERKSVDKKVTSI